MADSDPAKPIARRPTNLSLRTDLIEEAKSLDINISKACEVGLASAVKEIKRANWLAENRSKLEEWNDWVRENGIPYAEHRQS